MRPLAAKGRAAALLGALVLSAGCGGRDRSSSDQPAPDTLAPPAAAALAPDGLRPISVYFADAQARRLVPVTRYVSPDSGLARGAVTALFAGPLPGDPAGIGTAVPRGSRLLGLVVRDSVATVDVSGAFESGAGSASVRTRLAQLAYTLTRLPGIARVLLRLDGKPAEVFSAEGLVVSGGLRRADFPDMAPFDDDPPIVLTQPVPGSTVEDPLVVCGTANVFEAHVGLRIRRPSGAVLVSTWTTATCGTGCRGTFEKRVDLADSIRGDLVVEAFEPSAKDGSDLHLVQSPVHRAP